MEKTMENYELIDYEWHDASIEKITILLDGNVEILFSFIRTYHKSKEGQISSWSSVGSVILSGVFNISVDNKITDEYIDADLIDENGQEVLLLPLQGEKPVSAFNIFVTGLGTNINIKAATAKFGFLEHRTYLRDEK